jgi:hypothetical protein
VNFSLGLCLLCVLLLRVSDTDFQYLKRKTRMRGERSFNPGFAKGWSDASFFWSTDALLASSLFLPLMDERILIS